MDSRAKVLGLRKWLLSQKPEDEASAQQLQVLAAISPLLLKAVPDDPAELDRYLRMVAWAAARCRSDDAPTVGVFELVEGNWERVEMEVGG